MKLNKFLKLVIAVFACELAGIIGSFFTTPSIPGWYATLIKPDFSPPNWVFAPVWTTLFALMGIAVFLVWSSFEKETNTEKKKQAKISFFIFALQLALNIFWSVLFFGLHSPQAAFIEIVFLWIAILTSIVAFGKISKSAAWLLVPYIIWVSFAGYLNYSIWQLNANVQISSEENSVKSVVENFGYNLKKVSLLSPLVALDIEENYKDFLDPALLAQWKADSSKALGRITSSPWPDRIEITSINKFGSGAYDVTGNIIELTSFEQTDGGKEFSRPVKIGVANFGSRWLITGITVGEYGSNAIAIELEECLPKSDMASKEKCDQLLGQITNFDDCVMAGFPIMKSNPPQCQTPDGRNFIQQTNSSWQEVLQAIENCQIKEAFQTHSRIVSLTLKNENRLVAIEPVIDDLILAIKNKTSECGFVPIATE